VIVEGPIGLGIAPLTPFCYLLPGRVASATPLAPAVRVPPNVRPLYVPLGEPNAITMPPKTTSKNATDGDRRVLIQNRKARHDYHIIETIEAGLVLVGTEVKSVRDGKASMGDAYATIEGGEAWLVQMHISPYPQGNQFNHEPLRRRKLLLHGRQIRKLESKVQEKGLTLIPLSLVLVKNKVKVELGVCRGKRLYDKREATKERDVRREMDRARRGEM
jgi:SsrA-binding protein